MAIYFSSDLHLGHDREFIWGPRGFASVTEMNEAIIERFNSVLTAEDDLYLLGDLMLGDNEAGIEMLKKISAKIHIVWGNHDTDTRKKLYETLPNVVEICGWASMLKYKKYHFYLSHFPTMTANLDDRGLTHATLNLSGHTHHKDKFYCDLPFVYNVALDAHNCYPVLLDNIIQDMIDKVNECKSFLDEAETKHNCNGSCDGCSGCH